MNQKRKRASPPGPASKRKGMPSRKISATLIDFAQPILKHIDENTTQKQVEKGLMLAVCVWNAVVLDLWKSENRCLEKIRSLFDETDDPRCSQLIETLVERKRTRFAHDLRAISHFSVELNQGALHVHAQANMDSKVLVAIQEGFPLPLLS